MSGKRYLKPGELFFGRGTVVETLLGSCVSITLWYPDRQLGGICHFMLPQRQRQLFQHSRNLDGRYGVEAWLWLQQQSRSHALLTEQAQIKLFGGSRAVQLNHPEPVTDIGQRNIEQAEACLAEAGLKACARDLGGEGHRILRFDLQTGDVWIRRGEALSQASLKELQP